MLLRTAADYGALIKDTRRKAGMNQHDLARMLDTTQGWVSEIENGKPSAEFGMVLRALNALNITIDARVPGETSRKTSLRESHLNDILSRTRG